MGGGVWTGEKWEEVDPRSVDGGRTGMSSRLATGEGTGSVSSGNETGKESGVERRGVSVSRLGVKEVPKRVYGRWRRHSGRGRWFIF